MGRRFFDTYKQAANLAKDISITEEVTIRIGRKGDGFFVEIPDKLEHVYDGVCEVEYEFEDYFLADNYQDDHDYREAQREAREEVWGYVESFDKSEEDGWFYDSTEGDWEDNIVDPKTR